ncbi:MAG: hypothetical protein KAI74_06955, partial [Kiritimatiellae bacterium]|nr:hypothetical protein [Kiritimatiellia bacterium]
ATIVLPAMAAQVAPALSAGEAEVMLSFRHDQVSIVSDGIYDLVELSDSVTSVAKAGDPDLPVHAIFVTIPSDSHVTGLDIKSQESLFQENVFVKPAQLPHSPSLPLPPFSDPNPAIYGMDTPYPKAVAELGKAHYMRGRKLIAIRVNPLRYLPSEKKLFLNSQVVLTVKYEQTISAQGVSALVAPAPRPNALFDRMAASLVANPQDITTAEGDLMTVNEETVDYLLIAPDSLSAAFQALVNHRATAAGGGYSTTLLTTSYVLANYTGQDSQAKIRECIRDYVNNHNTTFVALAGGGYYRFATVWGQAIPADNYFADLDGTWDADEDNRYGEAVEDASEMDMIPDVMFGRITTDTAEDATAYINKLIAFETNFEENDAAYGRSMLMAGKVLWGWDSPTDLLHDGYAEYADRPGSPSDSEIHSRTMYRDVIRPNWEATNLLYAFDTISAWDTNTVGDFVCSGSNLVEKLNLEVGVAYSWFWTHGSPYAMEGTSLANAEAHALTILNPLMYTGSCNLGYFTGTSECLSEAFIRNP